MNYTINKILPLSLLAVILIFPATVIAGISDAQLLDAINQQRIINNLPPLKLNKELNKAAKLKAEQIYKYQVLSHDLPTMPFFAPVKKNNYHFETIGENLAIDFDDTEELTGKWMESSTHRQNIIDAKFEDTGIAIKEGFMNGVPTKVVVEYFGQPKKKSNTQDRSPVTEAATAGASVLTVLGLSAIGLRKYF